MADHDLLFLHHGESPGAVLASQPLFGENYPNWAWSIRKVLLANNKLGFTDSTLILNSPLVKYHQQSKLGFVQITWLVPGSSTQFHLRFKLANIIYMDTN